MKVTMVKMRDHGVEIPKRMLSDRYTVSYQGDLVVMHATDQGLRRPTKVARLRTGIDLHSFELADVDLLWANEDRFVLTGFERIKNEAGKLVDFAQSWLCTLERTPQIDQSDDRHPRRVSRPMR